MMMKYYTQCGIWYLPQRLSNCWGEHANGNWGSFSTWKAAGMCFKCIVLSKTNKQKNGQSSSLIGLPENMITAILWYTYLSTGNFPIPLLTEFASSTVMVVFRDHEGNTAVSGGVARFNAGSRSLSTLSQLLFLLIKLSHSHSQVYYLGVRALLCMWFCA